VYCRYHSKLILGDLVLFIWHDTRRMWGWQSVLIAAGRAGFPGCSTCMSVVLQLCRQGALDLPGRRLLGPGVAPAFSRWASSLPCSSVKPGRTLRPLPAIRLPRVTVTVPAQWRRPR
jgi:hypothetical protein